MSSLQKYRQQIDEIDHQILNLLNQRAALALEIAKSKSYAGESVYCPEREQEILNRLRQGAKDIPAGAIETIFRQIIASCRAIQIVQITLQKIQIPSCQPLKASPKIAYLGPQGTFSEQAAIHLFDNESELHWFDSFEKIFSGVVRGEFDYGVVPIENSIEGSVNVVLDLLRTSEGVYISKECVLPIHHCFVVNEKGHDIHEIYAHPQAEGQCRHWLAQHYPKAAVYPAKSNIFALEYVKKGVAAITSQALATEKELIIEHANIEDDENNATRFVVIGKHSMTMSSELDKTSIVISAKNRKGMLADILQYFAQQDVDLMSIKTRPDRKHRWHYQFFIDFCGHIEQEHIKRVLISLDEIDVEVRILGSYQENV